ncbi:MAG: endonuclease NucS domain-containing protein, partial [Sphaerospermopsis kisseleviana]
MVNEAGIRDFLINNLDIIEPDLKLVKKEFTLKNEFGADGRIDILAKDKFGMFVIIEIKKSDKAARESVQELCKYIALFKDEYGLAANKCRCILLSTEWHELLVPFSAFSRIVDYQIDGYQLILDEQGIPIAKKDVNLTLEGEEKLIFPLHKIFLFRTVSKRDIVIQKLVDILIELEIINYYILIVNYKGNYQGVIYPHAIYLVCDVFTTSEKKKIQKNMNIRCDFMLLGFLEWDG